MAHRMFSDASGREWLVWDVVPYPAARRDDAQDTEIGVDTDRLTTPRHNRHLPPALAAGWLCFESGDERRRLGPVPADWHLLPEAGLRELIDRAERVGREGRHDTAKLRAMARPSQVERQLDDR